mmetsp:Transcript_55247/g.155476  ORF Transcript_55247/g.155476 Transcript_55247/m.155476 type:complete len:402 (+) Transcript_55247:58-1263(+)
MPEARFLGGIPWEQGATRLPQAVVKLTHEEALALRGVDRMKCLQQDLGPDIHLQLLDKAETDPRLIISARIANAHAAVDAAHSVVLRMLGKDAGLAVAIHPHDLDMVRRRHCMIIAEVERESGCRILAEDPPKEVYKDPNMPQQRHYVRLLGDQAAQARAIRLLAGHCVHELLPLEPGISDCPGQAGGSQRFDQVIRGHNIELLEDSTVARRINCEGQESVADCVVGTGAMKMYGGGAFFCFRVRRLDQDPRIRGATRVGVSCIRVGAPAPDSLLKKPECSWVLGRGSVRGSSGSAEQLPGAMFDGQLSEGDALGLLVTLDAPAEPSEPGPATRGGSVRVLRRPKGEEDWKCLVHWDAGVPDPHRCCGLVELAGSLAEIQLLELPPPPANRVRGFPVSRQN